MPPFSTIKNVSAPRRRDPLAQKHTSNAVPTHQRKEKLALGQERQQQIDDAVGEWYSYTLAKADELGKLYSKKPRYFLDMFFQGGVRMVNHRHKTNAYNTFKSLKATELSEGFFVHSIIVAVPYTDTKLQCCCRRELHKTTDSPGGVP
jgi:hypothetical protein